MSHQYKETIDQLQMLSLLASQKALHISSVMMEASEHSSYMGALDEGFFERIAAAAEGAVIRVKRTKSTKQLNEKRADALQFITESSPTFETGNKLLRDLGESPLEYENTISYWDIYVDNAADNEDWFDDLDEASDALQDALTNFSDQCTKLANRLIDKSKAS